MAKASTEKFSITLPTDVAAEVRKRADGNVSAFLANAAATYIKWLRQNEAIDAAYGSWTDENYPHLATPEDTQRYIRELRKGWDERLERINKRLNEPDADGE